jgi:phosphoglycerol transferase MdoB-like AlkP superfamily enzyme
MLFIRKSAVLFMRLLLLWFIVFDLGRIFFTFHNWSTVSELTWTEWLLSFVYSVRLDLATAAILTVLPLLFFLLFLWNGNRFFRYLAYAVLSLELLIVVGVIAGEINAYPEWNHKLTTRVFMHFLHPDEVVRTADMGMIIWFIVYVVLFGVILWQLIKKWGINDSVTWKKGWLNSCLQWFTVQLISIAVLLLFARGGWQQIPINTDAAYYSKEYVANDMSVNSFYFFAKSFILYTRSESGALFPKVEEAKAQKVLGDFFTYTTQHNQYILANKRPNVVFILLESWTANAIGCLGAAKTATPHFDQLAEEGVLFTQLYATGGTSEIGNASIFSGYPALPEIFITMQPEKHRKLPSLNQDLSAWGYSSHYLFSGDLSYGNIGGYFADHGFDEVADERNFPASLPKGKLNYFDEDLYKVLFNKIAKTKEPFLHCAFTGSTHSPYDFPKKGIRQWQGEEGDFMRSMLYADKSLADFLKKCAQTPWFANTLFVLIADHGHAAPRVKNPNLGAYFHVPMLIIGKPLKKEWKGKRVTTLGSQADVARTLLYQMGGDYKRYSWGKDLLNPNCPEFALHTINRGFGWITPHGNFSYNMDAKRFLDNTFEPSELKKERLRCNAFMSLLFEDYSEN